jgi:transposase
LNKVEGFSDDPAGAGRGLVQVRNKEKPSMKIIGCDFHPAVQQIAVFDSETGEYSEHRLSNGDGEAERFYRALSMPCLIGIEACGNSRWFIDLLERLGHEVKVGDAAKIRASYVRKQKTDKRDAGHILTLLLQNRFPAIWTPSRQQRDQRQLLIHRHKLVQMRARVKNNLQHLALNQGMQRKGKLWSQTGQKMLKQLPLEGWTAIRRQDSLALLQQLDKQIEQLDEAAELAASSDPHARLLLRQKGVGPITALAFSLTIGDVSRFEHSNQVASYLGLIPAEYTSSNKRRLGGISKQGNGFLRMLLVEAAQSVVRLDPQFHKHYVHLCRNKHKAVAKVAAARKLAVRLYWILRTEQEVQKAVHTESRSGVPLVSESQTETLIERSRIQQRAASPGNDGKRKTRVSHIPNA